MTSSSLLRPAESTRTIADALRDHARAIAPHKHAWTVHRSDMPDSDHDYYEIGEGSARVAEGLTKEDAEMIVRIVNRERGL